MGDKIGLQNLLKAADDLLYAGVGNVKCVARGIDTYLWHPKMPHPGKNQLSVGIHRRSR